MMQMRNQPPDLSKRSTRMNTTTDHIMTSFRSFPSSCSKMEEDESYLRFYGANGLTAGRQEQQRKQSSLTSGSSSISSSSTTTTTPDARSSSRPPDSKFVSGKSAPNNHNHYDMSSTITSSTPGQFRNEYAASRNLNKNYDHRYDPRRVIDMNRAAGGRPFFLSDAFQHPRPSYVSWEKTNDCNCNPAKTLNCRNTTPFLSGGRHRNTDTSREEKYLNDDGDDDEALLQAILSSYLDAADSDPTRNIDHCTPTASPIDEFFQNLPTAKDLTSYYAGVSNGVEEDQDLTQGVENASNVTKQSDDERQHPREQKNLPQNQQSKVSGATSQGKDNNKKRQQEQQEEQEELAIVCAVVGTKRCESLICSTGSQASFDDGISVESMLSLSSCSEIVSDFEINAAAGYQEECHERGTSSTTLVTSCRLHTKAEPVLQDNAKYQDMVSGYARAVFKELVVVQYDQMDAKYKRSKCHLNTKIGFPGLACRYCHGRSSGQNKVDSNLRKSGRYFPKSFKTIKDIRTIDRIRSHLVRCPGCPLHVKNNIISLSKAHHSYEHDEMKTRHAGGWTLFFADIWSRLRDEIVQ